MRSIWLQARLHTATQFCGLEVVNAVLTVGSVAFEKAGEHRGTLRADPARARHGPTGGVGSRCKRPRTAIASRSRCWENRSVYALTHRAPGPRRSTGVEITRTSEPHDGNRKGQGSGLHKISDRKIVARWLRRCSQPGRVRLILEFCVFFNGFCL